MGARRQKHIAGFRGDPADIEEQHANGAGRYKRDVREATKYIETAIVVDKAMFEKRNGSTRAEVVHDAIQVANIADLVCIISIFENSFVILFYHSPKVHVFFSIHIIVMFYLLSFEAEQKTTHWLNKKNVFSL